MLTLLTMTAVQTKRARLMVSVDFTRHPELFWEISKEAAEQMTTRANVVLRAVRDQYERRARKSRKRSGAD